MATLAIRKTAWQALSTRNRTIVRHLGDVLELGVPAEYKAGNTRWFVFDDLRFRPAVMAYVGCAIANLGEVPAGYTVPQLPDDSGDDLTQMRVDIKAFCEDPARTNPLVEAQDVTHSGGGNFWQEILDAQNTPVSVQMAGSVPTNWSAVN